MRRPDGAEIHWEAAGSGPGVLLVPSFMAAPSAFAGLAAELAAHHRLVTWHLRGTGASSRQGPFGHDVDEADMAAVCDAAGPADVAVAFADGANRVAGLAADRPDLIGAVLAVGGNPLGRAGVAANEEALASSPAVLESMLLLLRSNFRAGVRSIMRTGNPDLDEEAVAERVDAVCDFCEPEGVLARLEWWIGDEDAAERCRALGERLWMLVPGTNPFFARGIDDALSALLPEAHTEEIADGFINRPDLTADAVRRMTGVPVREA